MINTDDLRILCEHIRCRIAGRILLRLEYNMTEFTVLSARNVGFVMAAILYIAMKETAVTRILFGNGGMYFGFVMVVDRMMKQINSDSTNGINRQQEYGKQRPESFPYRFISKH